MEHDCYYVVYVYSFACTFDVINVILTGHPGLWEWNEEEQATDKCE